MRNSEAVEVVVDYVKRTYDGPPPLWLPNMFKKYSYREWASYTVIDLLMSHPDGDPIETISRFMYQLQLSEKTTDRLESKEIFQRACEAVNHIILMFT